MKFTSTRIVTDNVPALADFYRQLTGIQPVGNEDYVEIETATCVLSFSSRRSVVMFNAGAAEARANHSLIIEFEVNDVDSERARMAGIVERFVMEPTNQPWGNRSMLLRDPDGNLINIYAPLQWDDRAGNGCNSWTAD